MSTSHAHGHGHDHGAEALAHSGKSDPTRTTTLRKKYAQRLRGGFAGINTEIRAGVRDRDVFGLNGGLGTLAERVPVFRFEKNDKKAERFRQWLDAQLRADVLSVVSTNRNTFVQSAYTRGLQHADTHLRREGVSVPDQAIAVSLNQPVHKDALQLLYTRNYQALQGITDEVGRQISRELTQGFAEGVNPRVMARRLTDRVEKIGMTRATTLARTEVVNTHATSTLNRFEELGVDEVTIKAEWSTAGDRRVCPICRALEGKVMTVEEARSETFSYSASESEPPSLSGEYPIKPPSHPQCRCALLPVVN